MHRAELPVTWAAGDYDGDTLDTTHGRHHSLENGALNVVDLKATATVTVVEAPVEANTIRQPITTRTSPCRWTANRRSYSGKLEMKDVATGSMSN
ncbi:MAG: hypothetical protein ACLVDB_10030 [Anaeromassilibacillus sp.]